MSIEEIKNTSGEMSPENSVIPPSEVAKMAQNLVRVVEIFKSDRVYRELAELMDRIPKLEQDIAEKEMKLQGASEDLENARREHTAELKRNLWLYSDEYDRFRNEKAALEQQVKDLQAVLKEKENAISGL